MTPVTFSIPFSFKDPKELRLELLNGLNRVVKPSRKFIEKHGESELAFLVVLERKTEELKILGPSTGDDLVDYTFWLPYKRIKQSENYRLEYLKVLREGLMVIFNKYDFNLEEIEKVFDELDRKYASLSVE